MKTKLFYDMEVFKSDTLIVFKNPDGSIAGVFWNNRDRKTQEEPSGFEGIPALIKDKILIGYNNYHYDDCILSLTMNQATSMQYVIKANNDKIIAGDGFAGKVSPDIDSLDTMQQIDVSHPSLKQIEANMGRSIVESKIDFGIGRPLTDEERKETEFYCGNDVTATIEVYKLREYGYFQTKKSLISMLPEDMREKAKKWNTTTIAATILTGGKPTIWWGPDMVQKLLGKYWRNVPGIPDEVWDMWEELTASPEATMGKGKSRKIKAFGCDVVLGLGGLHGAPSKPLRVGKCRHKDVKSMYPSAICHLGALGDATPVYDQIRQERIRIKHSDPLKAAALKLILNSVYGLFKNQYSTLCKPDPNFISKMTTKPALEYWIRLIVEGYQRLYNNRDWTDCKIVDDYNDQYHEDNNVCLQFARDLDPDTEIIGKTISQIRLDFMDWSSDDRKFSSKLFQDAVWDLYQIGLGRSKQNGKTRRVFMRQKDTSQVLHN